MTSPESLTLSPLPAHAGEHHGGQRATLDLLLPHDLPAGIARDPQQAAHIAETLRAFLALLDRPKARAAECRTLLASLREGRIAPAETGATQIPAKTAEVADFDHYFHIRRISSDAPALPLLRGLLQTASGVLALADSADLPSAQINRLVIGFTAYARLLARLCDADLRP